MGTPKDDIWDGVRFLPDYRHSFPKWERQDISKYVSLKDTEAEKFFHVSLLIYSYTFCEQSIN